MTTSKGDPTSKIGKAEDSYVQKYSFLSAGASILISASDNATTKKKFLKWAFLSQYPINKGEKKLPGTFCSSYITWILRVAESKKILQDLCNQEGEDRALNQFVDLMEHPNSVEAFDLKNDPKRLNILIDQIYQKHRETIIKTATVQLYPEGATPGRLLDYMKANPAAFKQIASIIPRNHAALAKSIG